MNSLSTGKYLPNPRIPVLFSAAVLAAALLPLIMDPFTTISATNVFIYIVITLSWALFSGPTQYISIATAAFFGIGIYTSALAGELMPFPLVVCLGGVVSFVLALLVGLSTLRLKGMYFTIFTFGLSELIRHFVLWWEVVMTGTVGRWVVSVDPIPVYYTMLVILVVTISFCFFIGRSRYGLALRSIGQSEEAADHMGINITAVKINVFAITAFFAGATGSTMATRWTYIDPSIAFNPLFSFMPVLMAIFGGIGSITGQIIGAAVLTLLADLLLTEFPYYYMLIYGIILVVVILFLPGGIVGLWDSMKKRRRTETNENT
ncbi:MAG TPA: branched-chain amino acid ABC transporter permease [Syntrophorhabdus sp.]|nr:branched-chain amino acid ABC transporter permease [Syntrophorhabdus sp.]MDI9559045.1 branched-chain amino acid ABC transporter permease [Pseudomonadota bacterium]OPX93375.1 MAG: leucine/isoleucine/valine transporter permease subunit [Syntrophorhabdus sp. PtaB.Bin027]OQB77058.1 MAG: leucine/isoleucine/valine transporter permease subunit [Deltaproteobacteria bacterium ADurb.Bin135]NMC94113.1 branched-chain amino acid ABC transporter permease [Syntrophorhabdus sp.]